MNSEIKQQHYPIIEIDESEPDIISIWQHFTHEVQVIQIEREKIKELIKILKQHTNQ